MCPANGMLRAVGYELEENDLPRRVTRIRELAGSAARLPA
jgi:hypothetical protein